jgi:hypothetical protein
MTWPVGRSPTRRQAGSVPSVQVIPDALVPVLTTSFSQRRPPRDDPYAPVLDDFISGLAVGYGYATEPDAPPLCWADLTRPDGPLDGLLDAGHWTANPHEGLRWLASVNLSNLLSSVSLHGHRPALMVSCHGIEASLLLAAEFWDSMPDRAARLGVELPGDIVVGVPARDVLVVTGSESASGIAKARRCVTRVFQAGEQGIGGQRLLTRDLLVRRDGSWEVFGAAAPPVHGAERWSPPEDRMFRPRRAAAAESTPSASGPSR